MIPDTEMDLLAPAAAFVKFAEYDEVEKPTLSGLLTPDNCAAEKLTVAVDKPL